MAKLKILTREELRRLSQRIAEEENKSRGEIRVTLHEKRSWRQKKKTVYELAIREFHRLRMHRTAEHTGILIYVLVGDRQFQILADEGIHRKVPEGTWEKIAAEMGEAFKAENFFEGVSDALSKVGDVLARHFPPKSRNRNELPDDVVLT
ncbi:MAG: TPM domain-containing protein [Pseudomonadota bacterium]